MIKEIYEGMTPEDKFNAVRMDFIQLHCEIDDNVQRLVDTATFQPPNVEYISIVDATLTNVSDILAEGRRLIEDIDAESRIV